MKYAFLGPESTGKTTTALEIVQNLNGVLVPEVARAYLNDKGLDYTPTDIEEIAKQQLKTELELTDQFPERIIICDTELITIEIWLEFYGFEVPSWIPNFIYQSHYENYFLFDIDLPWVSDNLRSNPADRDVLLKCFQRKLNYYNKSWTLISGINNARTQRVLDLIF